MTQAEAHRITIERSTAHVVVSRDGVVLADTTRAVVLHEGKLPTRYYIPAPDVRTGLLIPSAKRSTCPYKGEASYRSIAIGDGTVADAVWVYEDPIPEAAQIGGLLCFFNELVDISVDGEAQARPDTHRS